ncbi:MAG: hypothetical protein J0H43_07055 [Actinobacteria bacterium]|nr:hypothetical protein [Actinomycetota bacterium]
MGLIVKAFPAPPPSVARVLHQHQVVRRGDADEISAEGNLERLPNPWAPATCDDDLRAAIWDWCDAVAEWVNHEYAWRPAQLIPPCWPHHPHIAHELPVLAVLRLAAESSTGPELLEEWHRHTLPGFFERMLNRLGDSGCRTGKHVEWPARSRHLSYNSEEAVEDRQTLYYNDTAEPPTELHGKAHAALG